MKSGILVPIILIFLLFSSALKLAWCGSTPTSPSSSSSAGTHHHRRRRRAFRSDPYEILHVDPTICTQKEIQRQYRKLCLKYHPDKKKNERKIDDDDATRDEEDFEFKEVQHAYSLIGTEEDRRNYDLLKKYNSFHSLSSKTTHHDDYFPRDPTTSNYGWEMRQENRMFGPSTIYFTFGDRVSFRFTNSGRRPPNFHQYWQGMQQPFDNGEVSHENNKRPHYIQRVEVPLDVLYAGGRDIHLTLKTSIVERYKAAYNGGILLPVLLQSSLMVLTTWLRSQNINWVLSLSLFVFMIHVNIPAPPTKVAYKTTINKGWKGGTKIKYKTDAADITFILQEGNHGTYTRVGSDLHTRVEVSKRQLRKGCTLSFPPIHEAHAPIQLKLKPNEVDIGDTVTIKSRGWPIGGGDKDEYGDLQVKICHTA